MTPDWAATGAEAPATKAAVVARRRKVGTARIMIFGGLR